MASNINPYNIDGTFPIAGQDNSSQGFRDNFTNIKNNFTFARAEISDLQSKVLVTSALNGQTINNDMVGTQIRRPQLAAWTQSLVDRGSSTDVVDLDFNVANFQKITTAGSITLNFINWPASTGTGALGYGMMRVWIEVTNVAHTLTLPTSVTTTVNDIAGYDPSTHTITFDHPDNYVFEFSSVDGGTTFLIFDVTRNRATFRDPSFYFNSTVSPALFVGFNDLSLPVAQNVEGYDDDVLNCHEGINSISAGDLWTATPNDPRMSTFSELPGYHMYAARGNLDLGNVSPIGSNDPIGYLTAKGFTGNATGNTWQNLSSIQFSTTGTNRVNGLGGNIGFWTSPDGVSSTARMVQAVGIENDQSTKFFGNVEVVGQFKTDKQIVQGGTYVVVMASTGGSFVANANVNSVIIESNPGVKTTTTIASANITLPSNPVIGQTFSISAIAPVTTANVWAPDNALIKFVTANKFASGNVAVKLTYMSPSTWYLS